MSKGRDPIKRVELADGRVRYRFTVDVGRKPNGKRDQRTFTLDSLREARAERARIVSESARGAYVRPSKVTVRQAVAEFLASRAGRLKPSTLRSYADVLGHLVDRHGGLPLQRLDAPHLEALRAAMLAGGLRKIGDRGEPLSPRTVNLTLGVVAMLLKWAHRRRLVAVNVAELVDRVPADPDAGTDRSAWQTTHAVAFLRHVQTDRLYPAWLMSLLGLRRGEVLGLRWDDIDLTGERARERRLPDGTPSLAVVNNRTAVAGVVHEGTPKGRGRRRVPYLPLPPVLVTALRRLRAQQAAERLAAGEAYGCCPLCGGAHVVADELGAPWRPARYSERFDAVVRSAGLPPVPLHGARHTAASLLADLGVPDVVVAAWLGHTQVQVTHSYQHAMADRLAEAGDALAKVLTG